MREKRRKEVQAGAAKCNLIHGSKSSRKQVNGYLKCQNYSHVPPLPKYRETELTVQMNNTMQPKHYIHVVSLRK